MQNQKKENGDKVSAGIIIAVFIIVTLLVVGYRTWNSSFLSVAHSTETLLSHTSAKDVSEITVTLGAINRIPSILPFLVLAPDTIMQTTIELNNSDLPAGSELIIPIVGQYDIGSLIVRPHETEPGKSVLSMNEPVRAGTYDGKLHLTPASAAEDEAVLKLKVNVRDAGIWMYIVLLLGLLISSRLQIVDRRLYPPAPPPKPVGQAASEAQPEPQSDPEPAKRAWHNAVLGVFVILSGISALYVGKETFGSLADYINAFLWGIGVNEAFKLSRHLFARS